MYNSINWQNRRSKHISCSCSHTARFLWDSCHCVNRFWQGKGKKESRLLEKKRRVWKAKSARFTRRCAQTEFFFRHSLMPKSITGSCGCSGPHPPRLYRDKCTAHVYYTLNCVIYGDINGVLENEEHYIEVQQKSPSTLTGAKLYGSPKLQRLFQIHHKTILQRLNNASDVRFFLSDLTSLLVCSHARHQSTPSSSV